MWNLIIQTLTHTHTQKKMILPFDLDLDLAGAYVGPDASKWMSIFPGSTRAWVNPSMTRECIQDLRSGISIICKVLIMRIPNQTSGLKENMKIAIIVTNWKMQHDVGNKPYLMAGLSKFFRLPLVPGLVGRTFGKSGCVRNKSRFPWEICHPLRDVVQSFGKIRYLVFIQDRGEAGGPGVLLGKLKYKIAFLYITS